MLKVVPVALYREFDKDFAAEARLHQQVADASEHLVGIEDAFDDDVQFGSAELACHVAVLAYVDGMTLDEFIADPMRCTARAAAQIAVDLFRLLGELETRNVFHNDLHAGNIIAQQLPASALRGGAIEPSLRIVAIDLASVADFSRSSSGEGRSGDLGSVARHLRDLVDRLVAQPTTLTDIDYRLAGLLQEMAISLEADRANVRGLSFDELVADVRDIFEYVTSPWQRPPKLRTFDASYNAQTMHPWWVPHLLVDPESAWGARLSQPGPLVITGMRGCGKTMLLRALQVHARISAHQGGLDGPAGEGGGDQVLNGLTNDGYVGLYVSCNRLLDSLGKPGRPLHEPHARLFVAYAREALRAIRHLRELRPGSVVPDWQPRVGSVVANHLRGAADVSAISSERDLEHELRRILLSLDRGEQTYGLSVNPAIAFETLAEALRSASSVWRNAAVFYLLDDVSTRHLYHGTIMQLMSPLLFSSQVCAFKITTETQTLELVLRSPGLVEPARAGRDYHVFDLGAAVNERLRERASGKQFISDVLQRRAEGYEQHPSLLPSELLGDVPLEEIARTIATAKRAASERKGMYRGISALTAVCVGDIGDVIHIYESLLRRWDRSTAPVDPRTQSASFQAYCSQRLYHLNRRDNRLKDFALSFAEASHELLVKSAADATSRSGRLRQYATLYVNLTTGDVGHRFEQLRELIDAGVFVLEGGSDAPRTKTLASNPIHQFILTYRKLFGLAAFIGLAERDRFELSGADLEEWLDHPDRGRDILLRNLGGASAPTPEPRRPARRALSEEDGAVGQLLLAPDLVGMPAEPSEPGMPPRGLPVVRSVALPDLPPVGAVVLGLGFEERALASAQRLASNMRAARAVLIEYEEPGRGSGIEAAVRQTGAAANRRRYQPTDPGALTREGDDPVLVDVSGLTKPVIVRAIAEALSRAGTVFVSHTEAATYYPLDSEIEPILNARVAEDPHAVLEALDEVWAGEAPPYSFDPLLEGGADESRARLLIAPASSKHQRLLSLLDQRDYDRLELLAPAGERPRARLARLAAQVAASAVDQASVHTIPTSDVDATIHFLFARYQAWYVERGYAVEVGLTGSKLQAVAAAVLASVRKVSQLWYVRPASFDPQRFTLGVGRTAVLQISLPDRSA